MKHRIQNLESRIQKMGGCQEHRRAYSGAGLCQLKREEAVANHDFCRINYRLLPPPGRFLPLLAAYYRLLPHTVFLAAPPSLKIYGRQASGAWNRRGEMEFWSMGVLGTKGAGSGKCANLCGTSCGFSREVSRSYAKVRTDQGRGYAMLRIFTGEALFSATDETQMEHGFGKTIEQE
jgi:hypothetical protein